MIAPRQPLSPVHRTLAWALLFTAGAAVGLLGAPATAEPRPEPGPAPAAGTEPATQTAEESLDRMRDAGTAMFSWITDAAAGQQWPASDPGKEDEEERADWTRCRRISHAELESLLVPRYIAALPKTDAWGHLLEFCLDRDPTPPETYLAGIRSPGRDGSFEGDTYAAGAFPNDDVDRDLVWIDGFFVTWPSGEVD